MSKSILEKKKLNAINIMREFIDNSYYGDKIRDDILLCKRLDISDNFFTGIIIHDFFNSTYIDFSFNDGICYKKFDDKNCLYELNVDSENHNLVYSEFINSNSSFISKKEIVNDNSLIYLSESSLSHDFSYDKINNAISKLSEIYLFEKYALRKDSVIDYIDESNSISKCKFFINPIYNDNYTNIDSLILNNNDFDIITEDEYRIFTSKSKDKVYKK